MYLLYGLRKKGFESNYSNKHSQKPTTTCSQFFQAAYMTSLTFGGSGLDPTILCSRIWGSPDLTLSTKSEWKLLQTQPIYWDIGLEHEFYDSPFSWECHHPNWRTPSFFRGVGNQKPNPTTWMILGCNCCGKRLLTSAVFLAAKVGGWIRNKL